MPTVIDSLLVTLGLDSKGFKKGTVEATKAQENLDKTVEKGKKKRKQTDKEQADAQKKRAKELQKYGKSTEEVFRKVRNEALATLAVFTGGLGLVAFAKHVITSSANMYQMSHAMDMSARRISGWQGAIEQMGGSAGDANAMLQGVNQSIAEFKNMGQVSSQFQAYMQFGGRQPLSSFQNPEQFLVSAANLIHRRYESMGATAAWGMARQMGFSESQYNLLRHGGAWVQRRVGQNAANSGITEQSAKAMQRFRAQFVEILRELESVGRELFNALMPQFHRLLLGVRNLAQWIRGHQTEVNQFFTDIINDFQKIIPSLQTFEGLLAGVAETLNAIAHPVKAVQGNTGAAVSQWSWLWGGMAKYMLGLPMMGSSVSNSNNSSSSHIGEVHIHHTGALDSEELHRASHKGWIHRTPQMNVGAQ